MKIVLVHPLIPPNTGSIGRLCAATETSLVLVEPLGFSLEDKYLKRAGLDYWPWIDLTITADWREAIECEGTPWLFTKVGAKRHTDVIYGPNDALVFGSETMGLPPEILEEWPDNRIRLAMENQNVRSLNLAQCAAVGLYEARRQNGL